MGSAQGGFPSIVTKSNLHESQNTFSSSGTYGHSLQEQARSPSPVAKFYAH